MIDQLLHLTNYEWSLASTILSFPHGINVPDYFSMSFESILLWCPPGIHIGVHLGRVHWKTIWTVGWALCPSFSNVSFWFGISVFVDSFNLVLQARLCHSHELHVCVERHRPNHTSPWICSALLSTTATSLLYLRYKMNAKVHSFILLSFTLNQASATTSHSIMPSRKNGKFTWPGFVRGC